MNEPREAFHLSAVPIWQPDDSSSVCTICANDFSFWTRRHHCRACGRLVCDGCSGARLPIVFLSEGTETAQALRDPSPDHINLRQGATLQPATSTSPPRPSPVSPASVERVRVCDICEKIYRVSFYDHSQQVKKRSLSPTDRSPSSSAPTGGAQSSTYNREMTDRISPNRSDSAHETKTFEMKVTNARNDATGPQSPVTASPVQIANQPTTSQSAQQDAADQPAIKQAESAMQTESQQEEVVEVETEIKQEVVQVESSTHEAPVQATSIEDSAEQTKSHQVEATKQAVSDQEQIVQNATESEDVTSKNLAQEETRLVEPVSEVTESSRSQIQEPTTTAELEVKDVTELVVEEATLIHEPDVPSLLAESTSSSNEDPLYLLRHAPQPLLEGVHEMSLYHICVGAPASIDALASAAGKSEDSAGSGKDKPSGLSSPGTMRFASPQSRLQAARTLRQSRAAAGKTNTAAPDSSQETDSKTESKDDQKGFPSKYLIPYLASASQSLTSEAQSKRSVKYTAISLVDAFNAVWTTTHSSMIDVRPPAAYADSHPPRAISMPMILSGDVIPVLAPTSAVVPPVTPIAEEEGEDKPTVAAAVEPTPLPLSGLKELESRVPSSDSRTFRSRLNRQLMLCGRPPAKLVDIRKRLLAERAAAGENAFTTLLGDWDDIDESDETLYVDPCVVRLADLLLMEGRVSGVEVLEAGADAFLQNYSQPLCVCQPVSENARGEVAVRVDHKHVHAGLYPGFPSEILDRFLFLGSRDNAKNLDHLRALGITHILNVSAEVESFFETEGHFKYLRIPVDDEAKEQLYSQFAQAFEFIDNAYASGGRVLVHCYLGVSRSATVVLSYLIRTFKVNTYQALTSVKTRRPQVLPNPGFLRQICDFERIALNTETDSFDSVKKTFIDVERR